MSPERPPRVPSEQVDDLKVGVVDLQAHRSNAIEQSRIDAKDRGWTIGLAQEFCVVACSWRRSLCHVRARSEFGFTAMETPSLRHLIGGDWWQTGETFESVSPHDGSVVAVAPTADQATVDRAVRAAAEALRSSPWAGMKAGERASALLALADVLEANEDELARLVATEMGKPIFLARDDDVATAADRLRYFAGVARTLRGSVTGASPDYLLDYIAPQPVGPVALLMPWNDPIELALRKVGAALAAGCTVVMKSSELAPATLTRWVELVVEADVLPAGVINLVHGPGDPTGDALVRHPGLAKISFTGSTATGVRVLEAAASTMKRVTLECGGKAPCHRLPRLRPRQGGRRRRLWGLSLRRPVMHGGHAARGPRVAAGRVHRASSCRRSRRFRSGTRSMSTRASDLWSRRNTPRESWA